MRTHPLSTFAKLAALGVAALLITACSSRVAERFDSRKNAGPCPPMGAIYDVSRYVTFADGADETYNNVKYTGEIVDVRLFCRYAEDDPMISELEIDFAFGKGDAATSSTHSYPYFVSVIRRNGKVLSKEYFAVDANFGSGQVVGKTELIGRITIPRADETIAGSNFEILVGFDVTPEQLAFNRAGKRFRLDAQE
jgi:hypothetical protein